MEGVYSEIWIEIMNSIFMVTSLFVVFASQYCLVDIIDISLPQLYGYNIILEGEFWILYDDF